jgi:glutamate racemase
VRARLPLEDIVYLADQAHVPYGERTTDDLVRLLAANVAYLEEAGVDVIAMGCNTSCAVAAQRGWPLARVPILDLIEAAADDVARSGAVRIGILATTATARSGAYGNAIRMRNVNAHVQEYAAPRLVPLVEAGIRAGPVARLAVAEACAQFTLPLDALVLACTHYPLLDAHFTALFGDAVRRIDPARAQAERAVRTVRARGGERGTGRTTYVTTGDLATFETAVLALSGAGATGARRFVHAASLLTTSSGL